MKINLNKNGLTLIEVMFAFSVFLFVTFGTFVLYNISSKADRNIWESSFVQSTASKIVQTFVSEIRTANYSTVGGYPLSLATSTEIVFFANIDSDNLIERVRYFAEGDIFKKGITKPTEELLFKYNTSTEIVTDLIYNLKTPLEPIFRYYNESYNGVNVTSSMSYPVLLPYVQVVGIKLRVNQNSRVDSPFFELESKAQLRNLKMN